MDSKLTSVAAFDSAQFNLASRKSDAPVGLGETLLGEKSSFAKMLNSGSERKNVDAVETDSDAKPNAAQLTPGTDAADGKSELREQFDLFVGQAFFGQMVKGMRESVGENSYFHGGRAEKIFQSQLDEQFVEQISRSSASELTDPMFELFMARR